MLSTHAAISRGPKLPLHRRKALAGQPTGLEDGLAEGVELAGLAAGQKISCHKLGETTGCAFGHRRPNREGVALALAAEADVTRGNQDDPPTRREWRRDPLIFPKAVLARPVFRTYGRARPHRTLAVRRLCKRGARWHEAAIRRRRLIGLRLPGRLGPRRGMIDAPTPAHRGLLRTRGPRLLKPIAQTSCRSAFQGKTRPAVAGSRCRHPRAVRIIPAPPSSAAAAAGRIGAGRTEAAATVDIGVSIVGRCQRSASASHGSAARA